MKLVDMIWRFKNFRKQHKKFRMCLRNFKSLQSIKFLLCLHQFIIYGVNNPPQTNPPQTNITQTYINKYIIGHCLYEIGHYHLCCDVFEVASNYSPTSNDSKFFFDFGIVLASVKDLKQAVEKYKKAIELNPSYISAHLHLGMTLFSMRDFEGALSVLENARKQTNTNEPKTNKHTSTLQTLSTKLTSDSFDVLVALATMEKKLGHTEKSLTYFETALTLTGKVSEQLKIYEKIMDMLVRLKRYEKIITMFQNATKQRCISFRLHLICGIAFLSLNNLRAAIEQFELCLTLKDTCLQVKMNENEK